MQLSDEEYKGWYGLVKLTESRSARHFALGRLEDKLMKYEGKYPEMAYAVIHGLGKLEIQINNAIEPWMFRYFGENQKKLAALLQTALWRG